LPMMDMYQLSTYLQDRQFDIIENISLTDLATYIANGFIVGFLQGNSEHGSRALGNRSIFCNPIGDMKDVLNEKVKHREWYRPFAPLTKLEDVNTYFDFYGDDSRHMTFVADVKEEWKTKLPAITHEDGTGRLQTVTRWQNEAVYDLLTEFKKVAGHGVILNTSFNDNGKPILSRFSDALNLLKNTKLDAVYYHERKLIIFKNGEHKKFKKTLENNGLIHTSNETSVNVFAFPADSTEMFDKFLPILEKLSGKVERLTVITEHAFSGILKEKLGNNVNIAAIDKTKHYSYNTIKTKATGFENTTHFFSKYVKPFWIKDVLRPNVFDTEYHLFIDLSLMDNYNYDIIRDIKMLIKHSKEDNEGIGITGLKTNNSIFDNEFLAKRFNGFQPDFYPYPYIYYGNLENLDWFSTNYEGMLNWYLGQGRDGSLADYVLVSYAENRHRYKFLELEKV
jgi:carbamoyltransferase-like protein